MKRLLFILGVSLCIGRCVAAPIEVGAIFNLSGSQAPLGQASKQGALLAVKQLNQHIHKPNTPFKLLILDGKSNPKRIKRLAKQLAQNPNIHIVMGLSDNNMVAAAAPTVIAHHKIFITSGATSPWLANLWPHSFYMMGFGDNAQASFAAQYARTQLHKKHALIVYTKNMNYAYGMAQYFKHAFRQAGGKVIASIAVSHDRLSAATLSVMQTLPANSCIYLVVRPANVVRLIQTIRQKANPSLPIIGGDSYTRNLLINHHFQHVYFTTHTNLTPAKTNRGMLSFKAAFKKQFPQSQINAYTALAYDTVMFTHKALTDPTRLNQVKSINARILAMPPFKGLTGSLKMRAKQSPQKTVFLIQIQHHQARGVAKGIPHPVVSEQVCPRCQMIK